MTSKYKVGDFILCKNVDSFGIIRVDEIHHTYYGIKYVFNIGSSKYESEMVKPNLKLDLDKSVNEQLSSLKSLEDELKFLDKGQDNG